MGKAATNDQKVRSLTSVCSTLALQNQALTLRLFDGTIWVNFGDGRIINRRTKEVLSLAQKYDVVKTAATPERYVFAKRYSEKDALCFLEKPFRIKK